ncbi:DeoR/GlpR family DNA-binding transcription regulator [Isoptericola hypogeus]|uniref:DeoR/GlpR family DNA-binding transcription regulator n=1 Tax=Isoptericola hypogeus TaxID=300179 RepID=A0ABN2JK38_9MICO
MSRHQRLNDILELVAERGQLGVEEAAVRLGVSVATVRRDFDHLAQQQLLTRTHGGVVSGSASLDLPVSYKIARNADGKRRIAAAAAGMVPIGSTIALNGGTTTHEVARAIASRRDLAAGSGSPVVTVVTNALNIATELAVRPQVKILVVGGVARPQSYELIGPLTAPTLERVWVDIAFLGVDAVDPRRGAMAHHEGEAAVNSELAARAERVVVVADSSKLGASAFAMICDPSRFDVLLTDVDPGTDVREAFGEHGVEVVVAEPGVEAAGS